MTREMKYKVGEILKTVGIGILILWMVGIIIYVGIGIIFDPWGFIVACLEFLP